MGPLRFIPYLRPLVWGGRRLGEILSKNLPTDQVYGESWEVSDHPLHYSIVAEGPLAGLSLRTLMTQRGPELIGNPIPNTRIFPWLVKHIDASDWLSVQVHPNDAQAQGRRPGECGKTEVWFVLEALPQSRIYAGLRPGVNQKAMRDCLASGTVAQCLHSFVPKPGDCVFLPAGTVHAVGGGVLLVEIQQTSDVTFRLFDWNRVDANGKSRELHIEDALACINWSQGPIQPVKAKEFARSGPTSRPQALATSQYFHLTIKRYSAAFKVGGRGGLELLIPVQGAGQLLMDEGRTKLEVGQVWVLPATMPAHSCVPDASMAWLRCCIP